MLSPYQKTQSMYGMTMSAICGMLLYTMWEGLSTHDKKWSAGLVGGLVVLSGMKFYSPMLQGQLGPKPPNPTMYTGF